MRTNISAAFLVLCVLFLAACGERRIQGAESIAAISADLPNDQREGFNSAILYLTEGQKSDGGEPISVEAMNGKTPADVIVLAASVRAELHTKLEDDRSRREMLESDRKELEEAFAQLGARPARAVLVQTCLRARIAKLLSELPNWAPKCAEAHLGEASAYISKGSVTYAQMYLDLAREAGASDKKSGQIAAQIDQLKTRADAKAKLQAEQYARDAAKSARKAFGTRLREHFLDEHMDVKVSVSGANAERITLTFVLLNDVWFHEFKKGSLLTEMRRVGFKKVTLADGYDWGWTLSYD